MSSDILVMAGLGRPFSLGMLYDACNEKLIPGYSLFAGETLQQYTSSSPQRSSEFQIVASDSTESKNTVMDISASLGLSFMSSLVEVGGSARFLNDKKKYKNQSRVTLKYQATTSYQQFTAPPGTVQVEHLSDMATHVVTGILYGANAFFVFDSEQVEESDLQQIEGQMEAVINKIPLVDIRGSASLKMTKEEKALASSLSCKFHGDFLLESLPTTFEDAIMTYQKLPQLLEEGAKAVPVKIWLMPLNKFSNKYDRLVHELTVGGVRTTLSIVEDLNNLRMRCNDALDDKIVTEFPLIYDSVSNFQKLFQDYSISLQSSIVQSLPLIRSGTGNEGILEKLFAAWNKSPFRSSFISMWLDTLEIEIILLKGCLEMMKDIPTKFVSNQTELDREIYATDAKHTLCFVFTSLGRTDPYLKVLADYLDSPDSGSTQDFTLSTDDVWCYCPSVVAKMKQKAQEIRDYANDLKMSRNVRFLIAAITNEKFEGATIYHYQEGTLMSDDFTFPDLSSVENITDRRDLLWYACDINIEPNTLHFSLALSEDNKKLESVVKSFNYSNNPERFEIFRQAMAKERLSGRHYWELEWSGYARAGVAYVAINRKGDKADSDLGLNWSSWCFEYEPKIAYMIKHDKLNQHISVPSQLFQKLGVYLDWYAGTLSYYIVSLNKVQHIHTFRAKFIEPVYPAFRLGGLQYHGRFAIL